MAHDELIQDALAIKAIDQSVVSAIADGDFESLSSLIKQFRELRVRISARLAASSAVKIANDEAKAVLQGIDAGQRFHADDVISVLEEHAGDLGCLQDLTEKEIDEFGRRLFYNWISHHDYIQDIFKISTLIVGVELPGHLKTYLMEAKNCYAFQQYNAVLALSRTILEASAKDLCFRLKYLDENGAAIIAIDPTVFNQLIGAVASGVLKGRATRIYYRDACPVVHGDRVVTQHEAARIFKETVELIQELYAKHGF